MTERVSAAMQRFRKAVAGLDVEAELLAGVTEEQLDEFEDETRLVLPPEVRAFWLEQNGERPEETGLAGGFCWVSVEEAKKILADWAAVRRKLEGEDLKRLDRSVTAQPRDSIQRKYSLAGWVPLLRDLEGNYVGVDLDPGPAGTNGQVINFGRDELEKHVLFPSVVELVEWLADEIEQQRIVYDEDEEAVVHVGGRLVTVMREARA